MLMISTVVRVCKEKLPFTEIDVIITDIINNKLTDNEFKIILEYACLAAIKAPMNNPSDTPINSQTLIVCSLQIL